MIDPDFKALTTETNRESLRLLTFLPNVDLAEGGVVKAVLDIAGQMARIGHRVRMLAFSATDFGLKDVELKIIPMRKSRVGNIDIADCLADIQWSDCVHLHQAWVTGNPVIASAARTANKPVVFSPHGMLDDWSLGQKRLKKWIYLKLNKRFFHHQVSLFHCTAAEEKRQVAKNLGVAPGRVEVVPLFNEVPIQSFTRQPNVDHERIPTVLFLSRLHVKKGIEFLIDAVAILAKSGMPLRLVIAGPGDAGYLHSLTSRAQQKGIADRTEFAGMVRGEAKWKLLAVSDVFVLPTYQENFGLALIEAMSAGLPTITTRGTDIWRELKEMGAVVVDQSAREIAAAIRQVVSQENTFDVDRCISMLQDWLNPDKLGQQFSSLYQQSIEIARQARPPA